MNGCFLRLCAFGNVVDAGHGVEIKVDGTVEFTHSSVPLFRITLGTYGFPDQLHPLGIGFLRQDHQILFLGEEDERLAPGELSFVLGAEGEVDMDAFSLVS